MKYDFPRGPKKFKHAGTNIPYALEESDHKGASKFARNILQRIPVMQNVRRVASRNRFEKTKPSHSCTSLSYVHYKLSSEYREKRRLQVRDRPAGCILSYTYSSKQQEVSSVCFRNQVYQIRVLPFGLNTAPQIFAHLGHTVAVYLNPLGLSLIPYLDDWLIHPTRLSSYTLPSVSAIKDARLGRLHLKQKEVRAEPSARFQVSRHSVTSRKALLPESKAREIVARTCKISSQPLLSYQRLSQFKGSLNRASGFIPLGRLHLRPLQRHFHS